MTNREKKQSCGNAGLWTARKTKSRFSIAAHEPLKIADAIFTFPQPRLCDRMEKVEIQRPDSHFPTLCLSLSRIKNERRLNPPC
jgi:hypothetical protein